jgi:hypothetical protein
MTNRTAEVSRLSWAEVCARRLDRHALSSPSQDARPAGITRTDVQEALSTGFGATAQLRRLTLSRPRLHAVMEITHADPLCVQCDLAWSIPRYSGDMMDTLSSHHRSPLFIENRCPSLIRRNFTARNRANELLIRRSSVSTLVFVWSAERSPSPPPIPNRA